MVMVGQRTGEDAKILFDTPLLYQLHPVTSKSLELRGLWLLHV